MPTQNTLPEKRYYQALLQMTQSKAIDEGDLPLCFKTITEVVAEALELERVSIWFYNPDKSMIICSELFEKTLKRHSSAQVIEAKNFSAYFKYLFEERVLLANDVQSNPATKDFSEVYMKPNQIESLMDAPIRIGGKMVGVICCEHTKSQRVWTISEEMFIGNISDILARALQAKERIDVHLRLEEMYVNLEEVIKEKTRELEEERLRNENSAKMASLGEMAGSIAHEINNPLAIILGSLQILRSLEESKEGSTQDKMKIIDDIKTTTLRIDKIVKGLRFFARDASFDDFSPASVKQILENTLILCHQKFYMNGCNITTHIPDKDILLLCQPVSISQAVLNLLSNSFDAIEENDEKWIRINCTEDKEKVEIRVTDSGNGIKTEYMSKLMMPFFTTKPIGKGTGLGLPIVKGIVEQHQGTFTLDEASPNTSFVMTFAKQSDLKR